MDILNFLSNWLVTHIKGAGKKYTAFLNERGVNERSRRRNAALKR